MKFRKLVLIIVLFIANITACNKKELSQPALGQLEEPAITNKAGVEGLLIGAYSLLDGVATNPTGWGGAGSNWVYGSICGSEAYKGSDQYDQYDMQALEKFSPSSSNQSLSDKWRAAYAGVQRANTVLRIMKNATDIDDTDIVRISAEARFLRAHYHFEAKKVWNRVPWVDENVTYLGGNFYVSNEADIWPEIENDFRFAMENLKVKMDAKGRANKYAAEAFLAKAYMFQQKYDSAKPLLNDLIQNGVTAGGIPYSLEKSFHDNFNPESKNSGESVFAAQTSVNDGSFGNNGNMGDILNYPYGGGPAGCCGFFQPSQYLVNHFKTDPVTGLPDLDNFNKVDVKSDTGLLSSDPFFPYTGPLDPRLDWTVGRRGIPYLDWGDHPGKDWIRNQVYGGPYTPMKNAYSQSQQQHLTDASFWTSGSVANNINLIRFADVLLWAAEMETEVGDLEKARKYVNQIRSRAADPQTWVTRPDGSFAANYKIGLYTSPWPDQVFARKAIRYERMLELGMEGHRFFDLVRWGIADVEINAYFQKEKSLRYYMKTAAFTKNKNEYFPIPQTQIDLSVAPDGKARLIQNPGY